MRVAIGLGSNVGNCLENLRSATFRLSQECLDSVTLSSVYRSEPWGYTNQPSFFNAVVMGDCHHSPMELFGLLKEIEAQVGRVPRFRYGPREIDLDLLIYGGNAWENHELIIPHANLAERDFVLAPLNEIWPQWKHPALGMTIAELWHAFSKNHPVTIEKVQKGSIDFCYQKGAGQ